MSELTLRAITGAIYVVITLAAAYAGSFTTALLFMPVCMLAADECHRLYWTSTKGAPPRYWSVMMAGAFYAAVAFLQRFGVPPMEWLAMLSVLLLLVSLSWGLLFGPEVSARSLPATLQILFHIGLPFALLPHYFQFSAGGVGYEPLLGLFLLLWTNDTGAYLVGRMLGRHPLLPAISPKKTIEGLVGGLVLTLLVAYGLSRVWDDLKPVQWLIAGAIVSTAGTVGDLLESAMKRSAGVKDSGALLPGHGGLLDRFDGLLLASPALYAYLLFVH
jgi:phosphatidate cytidylyltransferase